MPHIIISAKATQDLQRIREYLAQFSVEAVQKSAQVIIDATNVILANPLLGKPVEDMPEYRNLTVRFAAGSYTICYRIDFETIVIVAIKHSREKSLYLL
jgi:plasmid stabilization system protein ParE